MEYRDAGGVKVRAILFDLGDTLIRLHPMPDMPPLLAHVFTARGIDSPRALELAESLTSQLGRDVARDSKAGVTEEPGLEALMAPLIAARSDELAALGRVFGEADVSRFEMPPTGLARVERFKTLGYRLGVVSNTSTAPALLDAYLRSVGLLPLFDVVLYSVSKGIRKPHPELYRMALTELGSTPQETTFVGDRVREDVLGPRSVGMRAILTHEFRQEDPAGSAPLAIISQLEELEDVLRG